MIIYSASTAATVANTAAETTLIPTGQGTLSLGPTLFLTCRRIWIHARGLYSLATLVPTITFKAYLGSTVIVTGSASGLVGSAANLGFRADIDMVVRTNGATGTVLGAGELSITVNAAAPGSRLDLAPTTSTINMTIAQAVNFTVTMSTASASNSIRMDVFELRTE